MNYLEFNDVLQSAVNQHLGFMPIPTFTSVTLFINHSRSSTFLPSINDESARVCARATVRIVFKGNLHLQVLYANNFEVTSASLTSIWR